MGRPVFPFERRGDFYLAWKPYAWGRVRDLIGEMHTLLKKRGMSLVVLVFPMRDQVNDSYRRLDETYVLYPQRKIREICDDHGIPSLDVTETLYTQGGVTLFRDHLHLNAAGNNILTNELELANTEIEACPKPYFFFKITLNFLK